jgi:N-acetylneuraminate lyase
MPFWFYKIQFMALVAPETREYKTNVEILLDVEKGNCVLEGLVAAAHSPFHANGSLNPDGVDAQAELLAASGIRLVFITGSTGESMSLCQAERLDLYRAWAEAAPMHGLEVVAHVGTNCVGDSRELASSAARLGFRAIAALSPCYFRPSGIPALVETCREIADAAGNLPFYYYDIPSLTGVHLSSEEFLRAGAARIPNLAGVKFTNPDRELYRKCREVAGGRFDIAWGIDEQLIDGLELGAAGAVGSTYNFAAPLYQELIASFRAGDLDHARHLQSQSVWLVERLARIGYFGAAKALMGWLGAPVGGARLPLDNPGRRELDDLRRDLRGFRWLSRELG